MQINGINFKDKERNLDLCPLLILHVIALLHVTVIACYLLISKS